jgi:FkbM family methyltransferase
MRARVVAVEPVPENLEYLRRNLSLNLCGDVVHIVELALADQPDIGQMVLTEDFLLGGSVGTAQMDHADLFGPKYRRVPTQVETLDRLWPQIGGRLDVIKLDIDGGESRFLKGGLNTVAAHRPVILAEVSREHYRMRGWDFDSTVMAALPDRYVPALIGATGQIIQLSKLTECPDGDVLLLPEEAIPAR